MCRFVSSFIAQFENSYVKFEEALRSTLRLPTRTNAPRKAKTKSLIDSLLHVQSKTLKRVPLPLKRKPGRPKKSTSK